MSAICSNEISECSGCGACTERDVLAICEECGEPIYVGEDVYEIDGETIHIDCLRDWVKKYRKAAGE